MIFVIEKMVDDHRRAVEQWEAARAKWVNGGSYRYEREYAENHPRPGHTLKIAAKVAAIVVCVALAGLLIGGFAKEVHDENHNKPKKPQTAQAAIKNGDSCGKYHVGDIAQIDYGDYDGAEVKIVGGCGNGEDYQVITTKDQTLFGKGSEHEDLNDKDIKAGLTFTVRSSDNLIVTGHSKE